MRRYFPVRFRLAQHASQPGKLGLSKKSLAPARLVLGDLRIRVASLRNHSPRLGQIEHGRQRTDDVIRHGGHMMQLVAQRPDLFRLHGIDGRLAELEKQVLETSSPENRLAAARREPRLTPVSYGVLWLLLNLSRLSSLRMMQILNRNMVLAILGLLPVLIIVSVSPAHAQFQMERLVGTGTPIPGEERNFSGNVGGFIDGEVVLINLGRWIFKYADGVLTKMIDAPVIVSDGVGDSIAYFRQMRVWNGEIVVRINEPGAFTGIYRINGSSLETLVDSSDFPNFDDSSRRFQILDYRDGLLSVLVESTTETFGGLGRYRAYHLIDIEQPRVVITPPSSTFIIDIVKGPVTFTVDIHGQEISNGEVIFWGKDYDTGYAGLFAVRLSDNTVRIIMDNLPVQPPNPGQMTPAYSTWPRGLSLGRQRVNGTLAGNDAAFIQGCLYLWIGGVVSSPVICNGAPWPDGPPGRTLFFSGLDLGFDGQHVIFRAISNDGFGSLPYLTGVFVYDLATDSVRRILGTGDMLDGKVVGTQVDYGDLSGQNGSLDSGRATISMAFELEQQPQRTATYLVNLAGVIGSAPMPVDDAHEISTDQPEVIAVLDNDNGIDDVPVVVGLMVEPVHGTAIVNADNTITYTPGVLGSAREYRIQYTVTDRDGERNSATVIVSDSTFGLPVPKPADDVAEVSAGQTVVIEVLANDTDLDDVPLIVKNVVQPANGRALAHADNTITYTPDAGFVGQDSWQYRVTDRHGDRGFATVVVTVLDDAGDGATDPPVSEPPEDPVVTTPEDPVVTTPVPPPSKGGSAGLLMALLMVLLIFLRRRQTAKQT